jgi:hypothetical protein
MRLVPSDLLSLLLATKVTSGGGRSTTIWRDRATAERHGPKYSCFQSFVKKYSHPLFAGLFLVHVALESSRLDVFSRRRRRRRRRR